MKRVLILGSGGAGKSTFARKLSNATGIPLIHLDLFFWKSGWVETPKKEWKQVVINLSQRPSWVMDGNYSGTIDIRIQYADTVIFLDYGRVICTLGVLKRVIQNWGKTRDDMPAGCPERFSFEFLKWVWNYKSKSRSKIVQALQKADSSKTIHIVKNRAELKKLKY